MKSFLSKFLYCSLAVVPSLAVTHISQSLYGQEDHKQYGADLDVHSVLSAAKTFLIQNSDTHTDQTNVKLDKVSGNYARCFVTPLKHKTDSVWMFLVNRNGQWTGLTLGTAFGPDDYSQYGIPKSLWIK